MRSASPNPSHATPGHHGVSSSSVGHHDGHGGHLGSASGGSLGISASATGGPSITVGLGARKNLQSLLKARSSAPDTSTSAAAAAAAGHGSFAGTGAAGTVNNDADHIELEAFLKDWRHFECKTWHLEPTVRLLSWTGKSIEPYGVDYILNKLGFSHARTTIPKWLQRGCMDPLDKVEALLIVQLMALVKDADRGDGAHK